MARTRFIVNPASHGGKGADTWEQIRLRWFPAIDTADICFTTRQGDAQRLAAAAVDYDICVAVGGDGTAGEVLSGIMQQTPPRSRLAVIPMGTGDDIARQVGAFPADRAVAVLDAGHIKRYDLIRVDCQSDAGPACRYAFLYCVAGFSVNPMMKPWVKRWLPATAGYYLAAITAALAYRPTAMTACWDDQQHSGRTWALVVANAEWAGGASMRIAPGAVTDDGELNASIVPAQAKLRLLTRLLPRMANGSHVRQPGVRYFPVTRLEVTSDPATLVEVDGDTFGRTPATFTLCPAAIEIITAAR